MDFDRDFAEAVLPDRWKAAGLRLAPFAVGHKLLLHRIGSPFATGEGTVGAAELMDAVWICSRPYAEGVSSIGRGPGLRWKLWSALTAVRLSNPEIFKRECAAFTAYIEAAHKRPAKVRTDSEAGTTSAPFVMLLVRDLMNHHGYSFAELMEMPLRRAVFERFGILEIDGTVSWPEPWEFGKGVPHG